MDKWNQIFHNKNLIQIGLPSEVSVEIIFVYEGSFILILEWYYEMAWCATRMC